MTSTSLADVRLPSTDDEIWRYSRIDRLDLSAYRPAAAAAVDPAVVADEVVPALAALLRAIGDRAALVVTVDGALAASEVAPDTAARGVTASAGERMVADRGDDDVFVALNAVHATTTVVVDVPRGVAVAAPVVVVHWLGGDGLATFPQTLVRVGEAGEATVVEVVASADVAGLVVPRTLLEAGPAAVLRYAGVQDLGPRVWQIASQRSAAERDATVEATILALGGDYARVHARTELTGQGSTSRLSAAYFGDGSQQHDFRTTQEHHAPRSTSDLLFKGAVEDDAHAVYTGLIRVHKGASGTNAFQENRNLVLTDGAHADSVPNLEIWENDVRCTHASSVGPIEEDHRYYLESRGVPPEVAERLVVLGFFGDVMTRVAVPGLRDHLLERLATKLKAGT